MNETEAKAIAQQLFARLRRELNLGTGEYLAALAAIDGGFTTGDPKALRRVLSLLWCSSAAAQGRLQAAWGEAIAAVEPETSEPDAIAPPERVESEQSPPGEELAPPRRQDQPQRPAGLRPAAMQPAPQPIQAPPLPLEPEAAREFAIAWPVSRRQMVYSWRYLRRPVADGPATVLDVAATVEQAARAGFFLRPIYRRRERNQAHLLLLID